MQVVRRNQLNRREAFRAGARWLTLLGLGAGAVFLGRGRVTAGCAGLSPCALCGDLAHCGRSRAVATREQTTQSRLLLP
jgi:hypothetical protein